MEIQPQRHDRSHIYMFSIILLNIACPLVYRHCINLYVIPRMNRYISEYAILSIAPPEIEPMSIPTAYMLVFLQSVKFVRY